jgi:DNA-binding transcriptional LysR family regulator
VSKKRAAVADWESLRFFLEAHRTGSLSEASRRLGVDHTTVARRIAALEASLRVKLFDRTPRGYEATQAAEDLLPLAERVEEQVLAIERHAAVGSELAGAVRVATTNQVAAEFVIPALPSFRERHPRIVVEVSADNRALNLSRREADIAIRLGRPRENGLVTRKLGELAHAFYALRRGRRSSQLDPEYDVFVGYDDSLAHLPHERWLKSVLPARTITFRANNVFCLHAAVRAGLGVALLPCFTADADLALTRLQATIAPEPREMWLVVHGELRRSARVRAVLDHLVERAEAMRPVLAGEGAREP